MILFGELVCVECHMILSYPLGAISCRCRNCNRVNAAEHLSLVCECCEQAVAVPINTLSFLCPSCATVTDIPEEFLPPVEEFVDMSTEETARSKAIYVAYPAPLEGKECMANKEKAKEEVKEEEEEEEEEEKEEEGAAERGKTREELEECARVEERSKKRGEGTKAHSSMKMVVGTRIL